MSTRYQTLAAGGVFDHQTRSTIAPSRSDAAWIEYQAWLTAGGIPLPPDEVGQLPLEEAKARRTEDINAHAAALRNQIIRGRSAGEMASWALKLFDALAVAGGQATPFAPLMAELGTALGLPAAPNSLNAAMATVRGITEAEYTAKVIHDAGQFIIAEVILDALRGKHCDAVALMNDVRELVVYDWLAGWPVIPGGPTPN